MIQTCSLSLSVVLLFALLLHVPIEAQVVGEDSVEVTILPISESTTTSLPDLLHVRTGNAVVTRLYHRTVRGEDSTAIRTNSEIQRNLRESQLFRSVELHASRVGKPRRDTLLLRDAWSLFLEPREVVGENHQGIILKERNLFGSGRVLSLGGDLFVDDADRTRLFLGYRDRELLNTSISLELEGVYSEPRTDLSLLVQRPFQTDRVPLTYGVEVTHFDGSDYFRRGDPGSKGAFLSADTVEATSVRGIAWGGFADAENDLFVGSFALHLDSYASSDSLAQLRAFENTVGVYAGLRSVRRHYHEFYRFDASGVRYEPSGGAGGVSIGKHFSFAEGRDDLLYFGAGASQSIVDPRVQQGENPRWFTHFRIDAGTGIRNRETELTLLRAGSSGALHVGPGTIAYIADLQVAWRWNRYLFSSHQESVVPLRGYEALELFGGNHFSTSLEYRILPGVDIGPWSVSVTLFHDMAGYWNLGSQFSGTRFHHALGAGLRLGHEDGVSRPILRLDVPYNVDRGTIDRLEIGLQESFDLFGSLRYQAPGPLQPD